MHAQPKAVLRAIFEGGLAGGGECISAQARKPPVSPGQGIPQWAGRGALRPEAGARRHAGRFTITRRVPERRNGF